MTPAYRPYEPPALPAHVWLRMPGSAASVSRVAGPDDAHPVRGVWEDGQLIGHTDPPLYHYGDLRSGYCLCGRPIRFHELDYAGTPPIERRCLVCYREQIRLTGGLPHNVSPRKVPQPPLSPLPPPPDVMYSVAPVNTRRCA